MAISCRAGILKLTNAGEEVRDWVSAVNLPCGLKPTALPRLGLEPTRVDDGLSTWSTTWLASRVPGYYVTETPNFTVLLGPRSARAIVGIQAGHKTRPVASLGAIRGRRSPAGHGKMV